PFEWTVDAARELIRLRRNNHDDFEFDHRSYSHCHNSRDHRSRSAIIQGIKDPISEDTEGGHILYKGK
ncbi:13948_t:CDS:2, partial [Funneliformis geosporum]